MHEATRRLPSSPKPLNLNPRSYSWGMDVDLLCFSHLRWDFVFQRPQHLLTRAARDHRVFYVEEPIFDTAEPWLSMQPRSEHLMVVVPHLPPALTDEQSEAMQCELLDAFMRDMRVEQFVIWCYTPMAMGICSHLEPLATVYDCMDELSLFKGASPQLKSRENELLLRADVVFTGGQSLYEAKRHQHPKVFPFPSSIDKAHFHKARSGPTDPPDQSAIPQPRIGFFGVLDERLDLELLRSIAELRPEWHFVLLGPIVKIDQSELPRAANIHYLGAKKYQELPAYVAHWDVATLLFARNDATRFISPTKTPEYLAAGKPVVSTSITDVVSPYGELGLVQIADQPEAFIAAIESALTDSDPDWLDQVDRFLSGQSWDKTWTEMANVVGNVIEHREQVSRVSAD